MDKVISATLLKLRQRHPFLATLSMHLNITFSSDTEHLNTDGRNTCFNPYYFQRLDADQRLGCLAHVTLHCALLHAQRCGARDVELWNIAADIVVNGILLESGLNIPPNTASEPRYSLFSVEQVYKLLQRDADRLLKQDTQTPESQNSSIAHNQPENPDQEYTSQSSLPPTHSTHAPTSPRQDPGSKFIRQVYPAINDLKAGDSENHPAQRQSNQKIENMWKQALHKAQTVDRLNQTSFGMLPIGLVREIETILNPKLDWRTILWRFMSRTPCDYSSFDRRFVHSGLYLESLETESLTVYIAIDTSGSILDEDLAQFLSEANAIANCYGNIKILLYYVDADIYGPYEIHRDTPLTDAIGGGGTDFEVFFQRLSTDANIANPNICIYLTDGDGHFPENPPHMPVLWVLNAEGNPNIPFGDITFLS